MSISANNWICPSLTDMSKEGQIDGQNCGGAAVQNVEQR